MKKLILLFSCILIFSSLVKADHDKPLTELTPEARHYYNLINEAEEYLVLQHDTIAAIKYYEKATDYYLNHIKYGYCESINALIYYYALTHNHERLYNVLILNIKQNSAEPQPEFMVPNEWNDAKLYESFRQTDYWTKYQLECDSIYKDVQRNLNQEYIIVLNQLIALDRFNRLVVDPEYEKYKDSNSVVASVLNEMFSAADCYVLEQLFALVDKDGFMEYKDVGGDYRWLTLVFTHNINDCIDSINTFYTKRILYANKLDSLLLERVYRAYYPASMYANLIDRASFYCDVSQFYASFMVKPGAYSMYKQEITEIESLDKRRENIGLPPYYLQTRKLELELPAGYIIPEKYRKAKATP